MAERRVYEKEKISIITDGGNYGIFTCGLR